MLTWLKAKRLFATVSYTSATSILSLQYPLSFSNDNFFGFWENFFVVCSWHITHNLKIFFPQGDSWKFLEQSNVTYAVFDGTDQFYGRVF